MSTRLDKFAYPNENNKQSCDKQISPDDEIDTFFEQRGLKIREMNYTSYFELTKNFCILPNEIEDSEDPRIRSLTKISYGFVLPTICLFGIIGNILNLIVLTRRNMQGTAYIYMRGYSAASLLAIGFCVPFTLRVLLVQRESGGWASWWQAFYHVHLELYLGNGCLGVGVMMLSVLTVERHASVCQPGQYGRPVCGPPRFTVMILPLATFLVYLPNVFRAEMRWCTMQSGMPLYQKRENLVLLQSPFYQVYQVMLEVLFKIGPTLLIAALNLRITLAYRRSRERRRRLKRGSDVAGRGLPEERRLVMLLGSTSLLFLVCVSPMAILNVTLSEDNLSLFSYQVFRALANLLEVINYSATFYIYCLFSEDFRCTLARTLKWPRGPTTTSERRPAPERRPVMRPSLATTTTTSPTPSPKPSTSTRSGG